MRSSLNFNPTKLRFTLATDLDGTFLGGTDEERKALYSFLEENREEIGLVFVTGRDIPFVKSLIDNKEVPKPDLIIGDVGTTVVDTETYSPVEEIHNWIDSLWDGEAKARELMNAHPHLKEQEVYGGKRVSYFYSDEAKARAAAKDALAAGYDAIFSANLYFDILPKGVKKGPTLLKLIELMGLNSEAVLTAGDTLNDLSLFETGLKSVAVGNSEDLLKKELGRLDNVYLAKANGAAGIRESIDHFNLF